MNRLQTICSLIPLSPVIADIGCDHGKISEYIIKNGLAQRLIVNDISAPSLEKAKKRLICIPQENIHAEFVCCDGADMLQYNIGCAIIAGMGGREILRILASVMPEIAVLAPQNYGVGVRYGVWELGYRADADILVCQKQGKTGLCSRCGCENHKFYDVLRIKKSGEKLPPPSGMECSYGYYCKTRNPVLLKRLEIDRQKLLSYPQTPRNAEKLHIISEVFKWQR